MSSALPRTGARRRLRRVTLVAGAALLALSSVVVASPAQAAPEASFHPGHWNGIDVYIAPSLGYTGIIRVAGQEVTCIPARTGWNAVPIPSGVTSIQFGVVNSCSASFARMRSVDHPFVVASPGQTYLTNITGSHRSRG
ncbi:hypothetical protein [Clavibacter sp. MX14-G9D]|uniref:hypothetical protein n=1 Tax=Clavibacter sp. MX14-G9D TaxID=3064656 RepID=UPI00293E13AB|nr:hypothetical protein [Clavibacter sp. MX14-G9D]